MEMYSLTSFIICHTENTTYYTQTLCNVTLLTPHSEMQRPYILHLCMHENDVHDPVSYLLFLAMEVLPLLVVNDWEC